MVGNCFHLVIGTQINNMAITKQTARKATSGAPTLFQNAARRAAAAREKARCEGGKEPRMDGKPRMYRPGTALCKKLEGIKKGLSY